METTAKIEISQNAKTEISAHKTFSHPEIFSSPYEYLLIALRHVPTR